MKEHMSITILEETAKRLRGFARRERRPVSQVVEIAIERLLEEEVPESDRIVTTKGSFKGRFAREDSYADR